MVFLDTNVFLYAAGAAHAQKAPCVAVLRAVADGRLPATTSIEVVQEIIYVLSRRDRLKQGLSLARDVLALFPRVVPVTSDDMSLACQILDRSPRLPVRDAIHAATMRGSAIARIVSVDEHFDGIAGIERFAPSEAIRLAAAKPR